MHPRAEAFAERAREELGFEAAIQEFSGGTVEDAAAAVGCSVERIARCVVLDAGGSLVVSIVSGGDRVRPDKVAGLLNVDAGDVSVADADAVSAELGWPAGGVAPFCHDAAVPVFLDEALVGHGEVWAAAGTPRAVFPVAPERMRELAGATVADVAE